MSLPYPSAGNPFSMMSKIEQDEWDAPLIALASKSGGDIRKLLYAFFNFLHRRTDLYLVPHADDIKAKKLDSSNSNNKLSYNMGFPEGDAERMIMAAFRQFPLRRIPSEAQRKEYMQKQKQEQQKKDAVGSKPTLKSATTVSSSSALDSTKKIVEKVVKKDATALSSSLSSMKLTEEGKQIPVGNGGTVADQYQWTQSYTETSVILPLPKGTRGKDLDVELQSQSISIRFKQGDKKTVLEGALVHRIQKNESTWSLEGGTLVLILEKATKSWWETVITGDDEIDTDLVDSTTKIHDYDEATQGAIRKIFFDHRQDRLGLPSSDEILGKGKQKGEEIPTLPQGVEFIDSKKVDKANEQIKKN